MLNHSIHGIAFDPADDGYEVVLGVYINEIGSVADMDEGGGGRAGHQFAAGIEEPVHVAIGRLYGGRGQGLANPGVGDQLFAVPVAAV